VKSMIVVIPSGLWNYQMIHQQANLQSVKSQLGQLVHWMICRLVNSWTANFRKSHLG